MIKERYVKPFMAQTLKKFGFDEPCMMKYNSNGCLHENVKVDGQFLTNSELFPSECAAPTHQMLIDWFREKYDIMIIPSRDKIVDVAPEPYYDYWCIIRVNGTEYSLSSLDLPEYEHFLKYEDIIDATFDYIFKEILNYE